MVDNVELNPGSGGVDLAADEISGVHHQRVKVQIGADGSASDVHGGNPLPISGSVTANAGSNLNTSALALESGGNLAALVTGQLPDGHNVTVDNAGGAAAVPIQDGGNSITIDGSVGISGSLPAGTNNIGDVDIASALPAGTNVIGDVGVSGIRTAGGVPQFYKNLDVDESEDQVKGTAGQVYWLHVMNLSAATLYLKLYDATAASVTVGTTTPDLTFPIPTQGDTNGAGFVMAVPNGIEFKTAITLAATTGLADNDAGAPGPNELVVNLGYA